MVASPKVAPRKGREAIFTRHAGASAQIGTEAHDKSVSPDAPASEALEKLGREDVNQLAVMRNGHLEGVISRSELIQVLQTRSELRL